MASNHISLPRAWTQHTENTLLVSFADLQGLGESYNGLAELLVNVFVYVDTLDGQADLAGVEEGKCANLH